MEAATVKSQIKETLKGKELNGFEWFGFISGAHHFKKQEGGKWAEIKARPGDLTNGNIEFFTQHGISRK